MFRYGPGYAFWTMPFEQLTGIVSSANNSGKQPELTFFRSFIKLQQLLHYTELNDLCELDDKQEQIYRHIIGEQDQVVKDTDKLRAWKAHEEKGDVSLGDEWLPYKFRVYKENVEFKGIERKHLVASIKKLHNMTDNNWVIRHNSIPSLLRTRATKIRWYGEQLTSREYISPTSSYVCVDFKEERKSSAFYGQVLVHPCQILYFFEIKITCFNFQTEQKREDTHIFVRVNWFKSIDGSNDTWLYDTYHPPSARDFIPLRRIKCRFAPKVKANDDGINILRLIILPTKIY
jgi:hypothetical protein